MNVKKIKAISLCALCATALSLSACGYGVKSYADGMRASADRVKTVNEIVKILDGETEVYTFTRAIEVDASTRTASVTDTKVTLDENYQTITATTTSSISDVTGSTLIGINLTKNYFISYAITDGDLSGTVAKDSISAVLAKDISASSDMNVKIDFENGNLVKTEYDYVNSSNHTVSVTITYGY